MNANKNRLDEVDKEGQELVEASHPKADVIKTKMEEISTLWTDLISASGKKQIKLTEACQQQQYNRGIEDLELWLSEIEGQLQSEDFGKDLTSVQNLLKKHALVEADVNSHQDRIDGVKIAAEQFVEQGHFDSENIKAKHSALADRYTGLMKPMNGRKQRLVDSLAVQQLFRDVEDEEAWIREKEPIISSSNRGRDLIGVQNLIKKHSSMQAEINHHEPKLETVYQSATTMVDEGHFAADEIKNRISHLKDHWSQLKNKSEQRRQDLEDSLQVLEIYEFQFQFNAKNLISGSSIFFRCQRS